MIKEGVIKAYTFAKEAHDNTGKTRKFSDLPYFVHPKHVARIIEDLTNDEILIQAAVLHDVLEDTDISFDKLTEEFGDDVALLVYELTLNKKLYKKLGKTETLQRAIDEMSEDALIIKLADRYHNVWYLDKDCVSKEHQDFIQKYYKETCKLLDNIADKMYFAPDYKYINGCYVLFNLIQYKLDYLKIKYNYEE